MEIVFARGKFLEPGPATVWMRPRVALVEGEEFTPLQRVMVAADGGNGVSAPLDWSGFIFINTDLSVHLLRPPVGEWVCLDAVTHVDGIGMTDTALWDERGRIGRAAQTLLVRARS
jgi:Thioesterase-like superfamily